MYRQYYRKFGNTHQTYNGYNYDSKFEASYAQELDLRLKAKEIAGWERQFKISIDINDRHICNYFCDFRILNNDGSYELVETKGFETEAYRLKRKLLEVVWLPLHPDHTYTVIKQKAWHGR